MPHWIALNISLKNIFNNYALKRFSLHDMFGIDRAIKNKDVWFSFQVLMKKVIFFFRRQRKTERVCSGTWYIMLQVKIKFRLKFFNLCLFSISFVS